MATLGSQFYEAKMKFRLDSSQCGSTVPLRGMRMGCIRRFQGFFMHACPVKTCSLLWTSHMSMLCSAPIPPSPWLVRWVFCMSTCKHLHWYYQCDSAGCWLLSGLPWIPARTPCLYHTWPQPPRYLPQAHLLVMSLINVKLTKDEISDLCCLCRRVWG